VSGGGGREGERVGEKGRRRGREGEMGRGGADAIRRNQTQSDAIN
jgi:hypothetical protein